MDGKGYTREEYDEICKRAEREGWKVGTKYRRGLKSIRIGKAAVLSERGPKQSVDSPADFG